MILEKLLISDRIDYIDMCTLSQEEIRHVFRIKKVKERKKKKMVEEK